MATEPKQLFSLEAHEKYFRAKGVTELDAPSTVTFLPPCRRDASQYGAIQTPFLSQDRIFKGLLSHELAIPHLIGFYQDPFPSDHCASSSSSSASFPDLPFVVRSVTLVAEVQDGLHGFNGTVHGGVVATLIDEAMAAVLSQNDVLNREAKARGLVPPDAPEICAGATVELNTKFLRPLRTPRIALITAFVERWNERRVDIRIVVKDNAGRTYAEAEGTFLAFAKAKI